MVIGQNNIKKILNVDLEYSCSRKGYYSNSLGKLTNLSINLEDVLEDRILER